MPTVLVSTIQERVRQLCDLPPYTTDSPITSAAILDFVATSTTMLAGLVKERSSELYFVAPVDLTTQKNVATIALPQNFGALIRLAWLKSSAEELELEIASADEFRAYPKAWTVAPRYRLIGETLEFFPTPDAAYTVRLYHSTGLYVTAANQSLVLRDAWDQWIVLQTAVLVRARQQRDASDFAAALAKLESALGPQMARDRFGVRRVRDLRGIRVRLPIWWT